MKHRLKPAMAITRAVNGAGSGGAEDDARYEDEPNDQQRGNKIQHHQEAQEQEVGLDTAAKVP